MSKLLIAGIVGFAALLLNIPMGYWRSMVKKYSVQWFLAIHLAVPVIFLLRIKAGLGYVYIPGLILFAVAGQIIGGRLDGNLG
ncbi:MAG: hypothetical protein RO469_06855 [Thermincola sp.]|nr:hypothetical protein [Thermincola sp.]MDT3703348.1 hypothetical protein [Thermincola sp.]